MGSTAQVQVAPTPMESKLIPTSACMRSRILTRTTTTIRTAMRTATVTDSANTNTGNNNGPFLVVAHRACASLLSAR